MNREKRDFILQTLDMMYPDAHCELEHENEFELLVAVILSAQTTDQSVNRITKTLFKKYHGPADYANASLEELQNDIRSIGLYRNKAKSLKNMSIKLLEDYDGKVPNDRKSLESLPGVGRKTANVMLSVAFDEPAFAVDTHVERVSKRLGFASKEDSVLVVETKLNKAIPKKKWSKCHHQFIFFGRYFCKATSPHCYECPLIDICREPNKKLK